MPFIEAPSTFYMGRRYDPEQRELMDEVVYYDSRDLTTHAVVVGMTGSGKTGMCIDLLEEAILDNIPAIIIDPKGDITNLLLTFPNLRPEDFKPWVNPDDANRAGMSLDEFTRDVSQQWREGLASWSIVPGRVQALKNAAQFAIYTPGSDAGLPISILDSLRAPERWEGFEENNREHISGLVTALLALVGKQVDPVKDREHVLLSNIFENAWRQYRDLTLEDIILEVQNPPFSKLGVFDVNTFFPEKDRFKLAMELNHIIAAPSFQNWITGEPLDIKELLYTAEGRPRVSIFYIAHLTDAERTFMIALLLENMLTWMRGLSGTTSLRAILYFDEVFGHFPPAPRNPPTKEPLLRLLKQARAFGIGVVLATQNPADLDYKGLSNAGTWFIGKLQTDNDKKRVLGGLQAAATAESNLDINKLDTLISSLDPRVFLVHNVHDDRGPYLMHSRWSMSYLRGPMTRQQVRLLMETMRRAIGLNNRAMPSAQTPSVSGTVKSSIDEPLPPTGGTETTPVMPVKAPPLPPTPPPAPPAARKTAPPPPSGLPEVPSTLPEMRGSQSSQFTPPPLPEGIEIDRPSSSPAATPFSEVSVSTSKPAAPPEPPEIDETLPPNAIPETAYAIPELPDEPEVELPSSTSATNMGLTMASRSLTTRGPDLPEGFSSRPTAFPSSVPQYYLPTTITTQQAVRDWEKRSGQTTVSFGGAQLLYKPVLLAQLAARYMDRKAGVEEDQRWTFHVSDLDKTGMVRWSEYQATPVDPGQVSGEPFGEAYYGELPAGLVDSKRMTQLKQDVLDYVYRSASLIIYYNEKLDIYGTAHESRRDFLVRIQQKAREARDAEIEEKTKQFDREISKLDERMRRILRETNADKQALEELKREDLYTTGEAVLGLLKGRTSYTLSRMSRARRYKTQAQERTIAGEQELADMEALVQQRQEELQRELKDINDKWAKVAAQVTEKKLSPFKKDIALELFGLGWLPCWYVVLSGQPQVLTAYFGSRASQQA